MKTTALLFALLALGFVPKSGFAQSLDTKNLASKFQLLSTKGGAGIDGGGSDGLEMESVRPRSEKGSVVVPVPDTMISRYGYLRIDGQPGSQQENKGSYRYCQTNAKGEIIYFGCANPTDIELNKSIRLPVGTYRIHYSSSIQFVRVTEGTTQVLSLIKIQVPKVQGTIQYKVFRDLTSPKMQDALAKDSYVMKSDVDTRALCITNSKALEKFPAFKPLCKAAQGNNYREYLNALRFYPDATVNGVLGYFEKENSVIYSERIRYYIVDPKDGDFVSVFPGVYGIEFTNPETGATQSQYGIVVE